MARSHRGMHKAWRHTTSRINPDSGKPEDEKFVQVANEHNITWKYVLTVVWWKNGWSNS